MGPTQHPLDISHSSSPSPVIDDHIPSRSYYSSHHNNDSSAGEDTSMGRYSASVESIRAQSLALGEFCMKDNDNDKNNTTEAEDNSDTHSPSTIKLSSPPSPPSPTNEGSNSNLSYLFQRYGHHHHMKTQDTEQQQEEQRPLITSTTTTPKRYLAIDETQDDNRRNSVQTLPDLKDIPPAVDTLSFSKSTTTTTTSSSFVYQQQRRKGLAAKMDHIWKTHLRPPTWQSVILRPLACIPSVILGLLLNLLDAISYGMITFPLNNPIFASFGPDGISMFFVSCIIAQLVYTCGGSVFDGGNGSMMIEVVPFLHIMAESIVTSIGAEHPEKVISTTMIAFALSSVMTGMAFFLLGAFKLGSLIEFFPRHILVATIGGVGWFLVATGIEVSARLDENLVYTWDMFKQLFLDGHVLALWSSALGVALFLRVLQAKLKDHPMVVPVFFMALPAVFYLVVLIAGLDVDQIRDAGWIFPLVDSDVPFWHFYTYYNFSLVDWKAVAQTLPAMLALTFFGLLHVPINVPALAVSTNKDDVDVNRELVAHGLSNAVSGCFGAVQNYLVYTNSLLFIRSGGDSRLAGLMLALATTILWMVGPWIVGYIPVMVVGSLIFHLGIDLLKEALVDTWHSVHHLEYITICVIVGCMATLGFVEGIFIGILTACLFFVVQNARRSETIRATFTGQIMRSTVRRMYRQQVFLNQVASQIQVVKLQGYLFFGTINQVERAIRSLLEHRDDNTIMDDEEQGVKGTRRQHPIRFLVLDLQLVQGLDFSAAEAFVRIRRLLAARQVFMIICNVAPNSDEEKALKKAGVWDDEIMSNHHRHQQGVLKCFEHLDEALEWCENVLLKSYFLKKPHHPIPTPRVFPHAMAAGNHDKAQQQQQHLNATSSTDMNQSTSTSPRHRMLSRAVQHLLQETHDMIKPHANMSQPTLLLAQTFGDLMSSYQDHQSSLSSPPPMEFYHTLAHYFEKRTYEAGATIWRQGDPCHFLIVLEQGSLRSLMHLSSLNLLEEHGDVTVETILPGTVVGELGLFAGQSPPQRRSRSLVVAPKQRAVLWQLTRSKFEDLVQADPTLATRFVLLTLHFSVDRQDTMTKYAFHLHH